jgi:hypothetical protein
LNTVGAPHLSEASTYLPSYTGEEEVDSVRKHHTSMEVAMALKSYQEIGYPPKVFDLSPVLGDLYMSFIKGAAGPTQRCRATASFTLHYSHTSFVCEYTLHGAA